MLNKQQQGESSFSQAFTYLFIFALILTLLYFAGQTAHLPMR
jgi:hypothetical protein